MAAGRVVADIVTVENFDQYVEPVAVGLDLWRIVEQADTHFEVDIDSPDLGYVVAGSFL